MRWILFTLIPVWLLTGCSQSPSWFRGKFQFDLDATMRAFQGEAAEPDAKKKEGGLLEAARGLVTTLAPMALTQKYGDTTVTITSDEILMVKGGTGTAVKYEIVEKPSPDVVRIKRSDGTIETWEKTPEGVSRMAAGDVSPIHFKRLD